jgi:hypothetical protein
MKEDQSDFSRGWMQNLQMHLLNLQKVINPTLAENKITAFLSSERARADRSEISAGTINNCGSNQIEAKNRVHKALDKVKSQTKMAEFG